MKSHLILLIALFALIQSACINVVVNKVTPVDQFARIEPGMTKDQVQSLMGIASGDDNNWMYAGYGWVRFKDGAVSKVERLWAPKRSSGS